MRQIFTPSCLSETQLHCFSTTFKSKQIKLYDQGHIANGDNGYRSVLGTQGVTEGTFYYEVTILNSSQENLHIPANRIPSHAAMLEPLLTTYESILYERSDIYKQPHTRVGFAQINFEHELPVGADLYSYSYRDIDGSSVHDGYRKIYGEPYGIGDTIGCLI